MIGDCRCAFCEDPAAYTLARGGLFASRHTPSIGICRPCARAAVRHFGEEPDPRPAAVIPLRRMTALPQDDPGDSAA